MNTRALQGGYFVPREAYYATLREEGVRTDANTLALLERGYKALAHIEEDLAETNVARLLRSVGSRVLSMDLWEYLNGQTADRGHLRALTFAAEKVNIALLSDRRLHGRQINDFLRHESQNNPDPLQRLGALFVIYGYNLSGSSAQYAATVRAALRETTNDAIDAIARRRHIEAAAPMAGAVEAAVAIAGEVARGRAVELVGPAAAGAGVPRPRSMFAQLRELGLVEEPEEPTATVKAVVVDKPLVDIRLAKAERLAKLLAEDEAVAAAVDEAIAESEAAQERANLFEVAYFTPVFKRFETLSTQIRLDRRQQETEYNKLQTKIDSISERARADKDKAPKKMEVYAGLTKQLFNDQIKTVQDIIAKETEYLQNVEVLLARINELRETMPAEFGLARLLDARDTLMKEKTNVKLNIRNGDKIIKQLRDSIDQFNWK